MAVDLLHFQIMEMCDRRKIQVLCWKTGNAACICLWKIIKKKIKPTSIFIIMCIFKFFDLSVNKKPL